MPKTKQRTYRPGKMVRHKGKPVAVVLTMDEYEQLTGPLQPRLDVRTRRSLAIATKKVARGEPAGVSVEEAFSDLVGDRTH